MSGRSTFDLNDAHFGRFTRTPRENTEALGEARAQLDRAEDPVALLEAETGLGEALTTARREREALDLLAPAVKRARNVATGSEGLGWALLALATAEHYADETDDAESHFAEALDVARRIHDEVLEHYTLHHLGRLLVDRGDRDAAIEAFTACLVIRERLGESRAAATHQALAALQPDGGVSGQFAR